MSLPGSFQQHQGPEWLQEPLRGMLLLNQHQHRSAS
jgi:hypothetical protein